MSQATYLSQAERLLLKFSLNNEKINDDQKIVENLKTDEDDDMNSYYKYSSLNRTQRTNYNMSYTKNDLDENKMSSLIVPKKLNNKVTFETSKNAKNSMNYDNGIKTSSIHFEANKFRISMDDRYRLARQSCPDDSKIFSDNTSAFRQIEEINKRNSELIKSFKAKYT